MVIINICAKIFSSGLIQDKKVITDILQKRSHLEINELEFKDSVIKADITVFLEHINRKFLSKKNIWIPNHEFISDNDEELISLMDVILCKTRYCFEILSKYCKEHNLRCKVIHTGFITPNPFPVQMDFDKDNKLFIHLAGTSHMKNTDLLINHWITSSLSDADIKLLVAIKPTYINKFNVNNFKVQWIKDTFKSKDVELKCWRYKNLYVYDDYIDETSYHKILLNAICAICPSKTEGFGHYINISRYAKNYIITLDKPPMNEFIKTSYGTLIKVEKSDFAKNKFVYLSKSFDLPVYTFNKKNLVDAVEKVLNMTTSEIQECVNMSLSKLEEANNNCVAILSSVILFDKHGGNKKHEVNEGFESIYDCNYIYDILNAFFYIEFIHIILVLCIVVVLILIYFLVFDARIQMSIS